MAHAASSDPQSGGEVSPNAPAMALGPELGSLLVTRLMIPPPRLGALPRTRLFTELGWPAARQLAVLALRDQPTPSAHVAAFGGHPYLFDYLAAEVLDREPPERRDALLQTAILERLSGPVCETLLGLAPGAGAAFLEQLEHEGLPLLPLDGERRWYRYHQLFSAFLRARLRATATADDITELHRRAAAAEPDPVTAIGYLLAGGLWDEAADRIEACALPLLAHGQDATVRQWIETVPPERREARAGLCVLLGVITSRRGELSRAEALLTRGLAVSDAQHSDTWRALAYSELALLALQRGEPLRSAEQVELALTLPAPLALRAAGLSDRGRFRAAPPRSGCAQGPRTPRRRPRGRRRRRRSGA